MRKRVKKSTTDNWKKTYVDYEQNNERDSTGIMLKRVEKKIENVPVIGKGLAKVPVMVDMVRHYLSGSYRDVPKGFIIIAMIALFYFLLFTDLLPDILPIVGYIDDAIVLTICLIILDKELRKFKRWRDN